ncbi:hypothetical protein GCM10010104_10900 [Streptomyces indiaensis]|uniref:Uncharacterized protein n=1 Tax=Streptomyces indiaensis TaxID=284033 RepID=A0ABP5Q0M5_9ACTN
MTLSATGVTSAMVRRMRRASGEPVPAGPVAASADGGTGACSWVGSGCSAAVRGGATVDAKGVGVSVVGAGPGEAAAVGSAAGG